MNKKKRKKKEKKREKKPKKARNVCVVSQRFLAKLNESWSKVLFKGLTARQEVRERANPL